MRFTANAKDLKAALKTVCGVIPAKGIIPAQSCVFIQAKDGTLTLSGRGEDIFVEAVCSCRVEEDGEALAPSRMLMDYVSLADDEISIATDAKNAMTIRSGKKKSSLLCVESDQFKPVGFEGNLLFTASGADFADCLSRVSFAVSVDESRPQLCGVHLAVHPEEGKTVFVALDAFKISLCRMNCGSFEGQHVTELTVPNAALRLISSMFGGFEKLTMHSNTTSAMISADGMRLVFPLIVKPYPEYTRVTNQNYKTSLRVDSAAMLDAVNIASIAANADMKTKKCVQLDTDGENGLLRVSAVAAQTSASADVSAAQQGDDMSLFFNANYLKDVVSVCAKEGEDMELDFTTATGVCRIVPLSSALGLTTYILPVRQQSTGA